MRDRDWNELGHAVALWFGAIVLVVMSTSLIAGITWADVFGLLTAIGNAV